MIERILFEYLVNVLWQLPLLLAAARLLVRIARPPLVLLHCLWLSTLALAIMMPLHGVALPGAVPSSSVATSLEPTPEAPLYDATGAIPVAINNMTRDGHMIGAPTTQPIPSPWRARYFSMHTGQVTISPRLMHWCVAVYLLLVALSAVRLLLSFLAALQIRSSSTFQPLTLLETNLLLACASRIGLASSRLPTLRSLADPSASPMIIGIRNPILLLPETLRHATGSGFHEDHLVAILTHELTHIRRRDYLVNLIARIASLPIAWHPAAIAINGRICQTREMICDAAAAACFDTSTTYARSLLSLAEAIIEPHPNVEAVGLFDSNRKTLEERIMKLTQPQPATTLGARIARIAAAVAIVLAATTAAATLHLAPTAPAIYAAQRATPQPVTPQQAAPPATGEAMPPPEPITVQAPTPAPAPSPAPAPEPAPKVYTKGESREMTPEERQRFDKQMDNMHAEIRKAMSQIDTAKLQQQIAAANLKALNSPEFKKQLDAIKESMKALNSPELREQMAKVNGPEFKKQMDEIKIQFDSPEFREQLKLNMPLIVMPNLDSLNQTTQVTVHTPDPVYRKHIADARELMRAQINQANHNPDQIQKAVDQFVKEVDAATKGLVRGKTVVVPPPPPPALF